VSWFNVSRDSQAEIEKLPRAMGPGAYTSIGGLDNQIAQIRDLLEIPLTRPDLFRHFGKLLPFVLVFISFVFNLRSVCQV